jgi:hypothetical protein
MTFNGLVRGACIDLPSKTCYRSSVVVTEPAVEKMTPAMMAQGGCPITGEYKRRPAPARAFFASSVRGPRTWDREGRND